MIGEQIDFSAYADPKKLRLPSLNKVVGVAKVLCPNPNITLTFPPKITIGCR